MVTQEINLNLVPGGVPPVVNVSQYDKGSRVLKLHLYLGTDEYQIPEGTMACIQGTKLDGTGFLYVCEWEGNTITADITDQMTAVPGTVKCEAFLQEETEKRIATANFVIVVERATLQDNDHLSETEIPLIGTLAEAALKAMASEKAAKTSEENAKDSEGKSKASENASKNSQDASKASQDAAKQSEDNAKASEEKSGASEKNAKTSETAAQKSAEAAAQSATDLDVAMNNARSYAVGGTGTRDGEDTDNAKYYSQQAKAAKDDAEAAKNAAVESRDVAGQSEQNASASAKSASDSQSAASVSENNAKGSADKAAVSESNAKHSESNAAAYSNQAVNTKKGIEDAENKAQSYAVGGTGTRTGEDTDNAKYYASEAKNSAQAGKNMDILEASGSAFVLDNSANAGIHSLTVEGKTTQKNYAGKNLHYISYKQQTYSGLTLYPDSDGGYYFNGRLSADRIVFACETMKLPAGDYILSGCYDGSDKTYQLYYDIYAGDTWKRAVLITTKEKTFTLDEGDTLHAHIEVFKGNYDNIHVYPMIRNADVTDDTFEPYVGGKISPSPDYPQEVESLENPVIRFQSKNILDNVGTASFNANGMVSLLSPQECRDIVLKFKGRKAIFSYDVEISADYECPTSGNNRFGAETVFITDRRQKIYTAIQSWNSGTALKAGTKQHFKAELTIGRDVPDANFVSVNHLNFYVQCIAVGSLTFSNFQLEMADSETEYEDRKTASVTVPFTLRSIGDIHDELIIREDGTGELIQRIWHKELPVADMHNSEDYPGWAVPEILEIVPKNANTSLIYCGLTGFCNISSEIGWINVNTNNPTGIIWLSENVADLKQSEWKEKYPDLVITLDLSRKNPVITELTADEVNAIMSVQTYSPTTVVYPEGEENIALQYYNVTVQGGQDQIKRMNTALVAENERADEKEKALQKAIDAEAKRAGTAEKQIGDKQTADEKVLNGLKTGLGTLEVKTFTGKCLKGGGFDVGRIATFPSHPIALWTESKLGEAQNLVFDAHAYSDGWFIDVTNRAGTDITDVELTIKVLIATPAT